MSQKSLDSIFDAKSLSLEDFVLVQERDNKPNIQPQLRIMEDSKFNTSNIDLRGLSASEVTVVGNIKKLVKENEVLKNGLIKHNSLIQEYSVELESVHELLNAEKKANQKQMEKLETENKSLKAWMEDQRLQTSLQMPSISLCDFQNHIKPLVEKLIEYYQTLQCKNESCENSLKSPIPETCEPQYISSIVEKLKLSLYSFDEHAISDHAAYAFKGNEVNRFNQESFINELKADLSERKKDTESLNILRAKFKENQELNQKFELENEKLKRFVRQLQKKVDQLEADQPSVEIMQVASPKQTRIIEGLQRDLENAKKELNQYQEEKLEDESTIKALNKACSKLSQEVSLQSKADGQEINEIRKTYEIAIEGLKDEIALVKKENEEMLSKIQGKGPENSSWEDINILRKTNEMLRKRENKDMDKMNKLVIERNTFQKDCEDKLKIIQELTAKLEIRDSPAASNPEGEKKSSIEEDQYELIPSQDIVLKQKIIEELQQKIQADQTVIIALNKEISELEAGQKSQDCEGCRGLGEENEMFSRKVKSLYEEISNRDGILNQQHQKWGDMQRKMNQLQHMTENSKRENEEYKRLQSNDKDEIRDLRQKLTNYAEQLQAGAKEFHECNNKFEECRQRNSNLEERLEKTANDLGIVWTNLQTKINYITKMEGQLKYQEEAALGMNQRIKNLEKQLNDEAEHNELLKQQIGVYENDFNIEREAREKQHSDILILREEVHHLKLENHRLREDMDGAQRYQMAQLQKRFGVGPAGRETSGMSQDIPGLYGRGAAVPDNRNTGSYQANNSAGARMDTAQEQDQNVQRICPKCHSPFPDLDTLQIHVLECLDE